MKSAANSETDTSTSSDSEGFNNNEKSDSSTNSTNGNESISYESDGDIITYHKHGFQNNYPHSISANNNNDNDNSNSNESSVLIISNDNMKSQPSSPLEEAEIPQIPNDILSQDYTVKYFNNIDTKLEAVLSGMKEFFVFYNKYYNDNKALISENKRLTVELTQANDYINELEDRLANMSQSSFGHISQSGSMGSIGSNDSSEPSTPVSTDLYYHFKSFDETLLSTNSTVEQPDKLFTAYNVYMIGRILYFIGDLIIKIVPLHGISHSDDEQEAYKNDYHVIFEREELFNKSYYKFLRNGDRRYNDTLICLGFNDTKHRKGSYIDLLNLTTGEISACEYPITNKIYDMMLYDNGCAISYLENEYYKVGKAQMNLIQENQFCKRDLQSFNDDILFIEISPFLYSHNGQICFWFNGKFKPKQSIVATPKFISSNSSRAKLQLQPLEIDELSDKVFRRFSNVRKSNDEFGINDLHKKGHHHSKQRRRTNSINEDDVIPHKKESNKIDMRSSIKRDKQFVSKLQRAMNNNRNEKPIELSKSKQYNQSQIIPDDELTNCLFVKKAGKSPEIIKLPKSCGRAISAHPYRTGFFVLTDKQLLLKITGLHDNDPSCHIQEITLEPQPDDKLTRIYLKHPYKFVSVKGLDNSFFIQSNRALYRVKSIQDDTFYIEKIYTVGTKQKIINVRFLEKSITLYLSDYSFIDIVFQGYTFQTYAHIGIKVSRK